MAEISLTASMRSNLLSLQNTQDLMDMTQERLSTGKKVNSAIDNPSSYYTAQSLTNRASDLNALLDSMGQGIQTIQAANEGIETITSFAQQAKAIVNSARDTAPKKDPVESSGTFAAGTAAATEVTFEFTFNGEDVELKFNNAGTGEDIDDLVTNLQGALDTAVPDTFTVTNNDGVISIDALADNPNATWTISGTVNGLTISGKQGSEERLAYEDQYNEILRQIDQVAKDSGYKGVNLLQENDLTVVFNEDRSSDLLIEGVDASSEGLELLPAADWSNADNQAIDQTIQSVEDAINTLRSMASTFGNNYSIVQNREDFTENLINVLEEGSDKLTLADMNEESANMLALQTRQQLAINSLSLASQAAQSVLSLFG